MSRSGASLFVGCILITACLGSGACSSDESASKVGRRSDAVEDGLGPWLDTPNFDSFNLHAIIDGSVAGQPNLHDNMWGDCHVGGGSCTLPSGVNNWSEIFRNPTIAESDTLKKAIRTIVGRIVSGDFTSAYVLNDPSVTALSTINYEADTHYDSFMDRMIIVVRQKPSRQATTTRTTAIRFGPIVDAIGAHSFSTKSRRIGRSSRRRILALMMVRSSWRWTPSKRETASR